MEVIGKQNVPAVGPVIFTGNHMNQFVDGAVILITNPRRVGFLVAEASMKKRVIGDFARGTNCTAFVSIMFLVEFVFVFGKVRIRYLLYCTLCYIACGSIPVARPQDTAKPGPGRIYFDKLRIVGEGTHFTQLQKGDKLRCVIFVCFVCLFIYF